MTSGLEYNITLGGTKQPCADLGCWTSNCIIDTDQDFIRLEQSTGTAVTLGDPPPAWCTGFLVGRTWTFAPFFFNSVGFSGDLDPIVLNDFNIGVRYYDTEVFTPNPSGPNDPTIYPDTVTRTYADFVIVNQTLTMTDASNDPPDRVIFSVQPNEANLYSLAPGTYQSGTAAAPIWNNSGITNGSAYEYGGCFNEGNISYIPRLSPGGQGAVKDSVPSAPYDSDEGIYAIGTLTGYVPDDRESMTVTYTLVTEWHPAISPETVSTDTITITQTVTQPTVTSEQIGRAIRQNLQRAYYTKGDYNFRDEFSLWDVFEDPLYERDGTPIDPVPRYNEQTNSFYDQETNGEGFNGVDE